MKNKETLVANLFAAPGSGKSTMASGLFYKLKCENINCEIPGEYAKVLAWSNRTETVKDQFYVFGKQHHRVWSLKGKVDVIIADSPIMLNLAYAQDYPDCFKETVKWSFDQYRNINFLVNRVKPYNPAGRFQSENESDEKQQEILGILKEYTIPFYMIDGNEAGLEKCLEIIKKELDR